MPLISPRTKEAVLTVACRRLVAPMGRANTLGRVIAMAAADRDIHRVTVKAMATRIWAEHCTGNRAGARRGLSLVKTLRADLATERLSPHRRIGRFEYAAEIFNRARRVYPAAR